MKDFYGASICADMETPLAGVYTSEYISTRARVAVYDGPASAPYVEEVEPAPVREYIGALAARVYELAHSRGGDIPFTVVRELAENYIHAGFAEPVVSILEGGNTIRFSDQGPGILDKDLAMRAGYTTATSSMKGVIRGVGSGLPIVKEFLALSGGALEIGDNLHSGSVITIRSRSLRPQVKPVPDSAASDALAGLDAPAPGRPSLDLGLCDTSAPGCGVRLTTRQKQVLALVLESGSVGPSIVSRELRVGLSTAYRDLASLEEFGLIVSEGGKRALTPAGMSYLGEMASPES